nr:hypothetical protein [Tanacetum cinerariifolium]
VIPRDGIFEIDLSNSYTNNSSTYAVSNKRAKLNLDSSLLWHFCLGHISKKRIQKLQHDRLLNSTNLRDFENCVSCMSGKMAWKPYTHQVERAKDLLGLIHTDEVENQLGKTIKSLRYDCGGEYMRQEFLDHLKDHGIITHRTSPYTPQHNGYPKETMRYSFYYPPENKVLVAQNVEFLENSLITQEASGSLEDLEIIQEEVYGGDIKRELRVSCYTDAGYLTDADDLKSQTGYVIILNGGLLIERVPSKAFLLLHL